VPSEHTKRYRSYLIRCWLSVETESSAATVERFIVEVVSDEPRRWGFDTFDELVAFLRAEMLEPERAKPRPEAGAHDE
jgi:hypothetical protein